MTKPLQVKARRGVLPASLTEVTRLQPQASVEQIIVATATFLTLAANGRFLVAALQGSSPLEPSTWGFGLALTAGLLAINVLMLAVLATRLSIKPVATVLIVAAALASHFMVSYGVFMDPSMLRNVLRTHPAEARELLSLSLVLHLLLYAVLPLLLLWRVQVLERPWKGAVLARSVCVAAALAVLLVSLGAVFRPLSSLMRNHKELRYLITPANVLWSTGAVIAADFKGAARPREAIGLDARPGPSWASRQKPLVVVLIVGETTRTANWGLAGYARQTTPELMRLPVMSLPSLSACGTNTEVSLPCMFAPVGRRDYDEGRIRGQDSALHVLARAGVAVHWRDNQSGCKGVCEGLPSEELSAALAPGLCPDGRCFDEGLVRDLDDRLQRARGTQVWVLHMLGSHGPSYYRRYPATFARFLPDCRKDELRDCSQAEIVNAYDNSVIYTDHVVATAIRKLRAAQDKVDSALIFVSDHGESLGENGLYLHGMPYAVAPKVQTEVPMVMWTSPGLASAAGLRPNCLQTQLNGRSPEGLSHDVLFHTLLGLTDVRSQLHLPQLDLTNGCGSSAAGAP